MYIPVHMITSWLTGVHNMSYKTTKKQCCSVVPSVSSEEIVSWHHVVLPLV